MNELHLFAGAGGGILAGQQLGHRCVCAVEWEPYAQAVLVARQNDGSLPPFPIWDDVQTFDGRPWRGIVDIVAGGFPCQDISVAGKGAGIDGAKSGMWGHMARIIGEVRPKHVFVENSPALITRGLGRVLGDLAALGYDCRWTVLGAADVGAPHQRDRFWLRAELRDVLPHAEHDRAGRWQQQSAGTCEACSRFFARFRCNAPEECDCPRCQGYCKCEVADAHGVRELQPQGSQCNEREWVGDCGSESCHADSAGLAQRQGQPSHARQELPPIERADWWQFEPDVGRVANGVAARVDRLKAIGNGQVPACAAAAWRILNAP